jgi:DNA-binding CsgD family transcriptional regulator
MQHFCSITARVLIVQAKELMEVLRLANCSSGLTDREKRILELKAKNPGLTDYRIARMLRVSPVSVKESRVNALRKVEKARADLIFIGRLESKGSQADFKLR